MNKDKIENVAFLIASTLFMITLAWRPTSNLGRNVYATLIIITFVMYAFDIVYTIRRKLQARKANK
ncbi:hypothetical protein [Lactobacillus kalixensis]|uniref:Uncharacterized protein n=1 Tax=Lactobacillus kalixensis DSM 16043 TaxID=1423763 RepID=A0A0R1U755_9LACO|nr:hypothetical protein [Lactobacillus kalixensis]KRL89040.1 hypothetical protein FC46_GL001195 [Lactobacillus kalixensis DSM 16043]